MATRLIYQGQLYFVSRWNTSRRRIQYIFYIYPQGRKRAAVVYLSGFMQAQHHINYDLAIWQVYSPCGEVLASGSERKALGSRRQAEKALKAFMAEHKGSPNRTQITSPGWFLGRDSPLGPLSD